jgi:LytR cell envelope-related transcriptional attenuator
VEQSHSFSQVRSPWRTATLVASAVAALELLLLVVLGVMLLAEPVTQHVRQAAEAKVFAPVKPKPRAAANKPIGKPKLSRGKTSVIVLNGNGRAGAAAASAEAVRRFGYTIGTVGNAPRTDFTRTLVMFRKGYRPEAVRLAKDLNLKIVGPLDGLRPKDMLGAHVALVVGS